MLCSWLFALRFSSVFGLATAAVTAPRKSQLRIPRWGHATSCPVVHSLEGSSAGRAERSSRKRQRRSVFKRNTSGTVFRAASFLPKDRLTDEWPLEGVEAGGKSSRPCPHCAGTGLAPRRIPRWIELLIP